MTAIVQSGQLALTDEEGQLLYECEQTIEREMSALYTAGLRVGAALSEVNARRLWRGQNGSFEQYCASRWGLKVRRAYELMEAAGVVANLGDISHAAPIRESHVAPLAKLPPELQREAYRKALAASNGKPQATDVKRAVAEILPPKTSALPGVNGAEDDYEPCHDCGERHLPTLPCAPPAQPPLAGERIEFSADSGETWQDAAGAARQVPAQTAPAQNAQEGTSRARETASGPVSVSSPTPGAEVRQDASPASPEEPEWTLAVRVSREDALWLEQRNLSAREVIEAFRAGVDQAEGIGMTPEEALAVALRVHAAASAKGWSVERMLKTVERPGLK